MGVFFLQLFSKLVTLAIIQFLAIYSPGPDITLIIKNSITYSKKHAFFTILGILNGQSIHIVYNLLGLNFLKENSSILNYIGILGGTYILYIGIKSFYAGYKLLNNKSESLHKFEHSNQNKSYFSVYKTGLLTNILNPKAILFYLCLFSTIVDNNTSTILMILIGIFSILFSFIYFNSISLVFSYSKIRNRFYKNIHWVEIISGILFVLISSLLIFNSLKKMI